MSMTKLNEWTKIGDLYVQVLDVQELQAKASMPVSSTFHHSLKIHKYEYEERRCKSCMQSCNDDWLTTASEQPTYLSLSNSCDCRSNYFYRWPWQRGYCAVALAAVSYYFRRVPGSSSSVHAGVRSKCVKLAGFSLQNVTGERFQINPATCQVRPCFFSASTYRCCVSPQIFDRSAAADCRLSSAC